MIRDISFIYFDVGGVLLKDYSCTNKWEEMKQGLGVTEATSEVFEELWNHYAKARVCLDYDVDNLVPVLVKELGLSLPENYSMLDDFVARFERNDSIWPLVQKLEQNYRLGILTNMYPRMLGKIKQAKLLDPIKWLEVDSSIVQLRKPDRALYQLAQKKAGVAAEKILFIDNSRGHLEAAAELGWQTFYYDSCDYEASTQQLAQELGIEL